MPGVEKISIALPPEMVASIRKAVETGEYASSSEVVRDALHEWTLTRDLRQQSLGELRTLWRQALGNKTLGTPVDEMLDRLEHKYQVLADAAR
jgi:antitoxin ParD1/3/4